MSKHILYVASSSHISPAIRLPSAKIGVTGNQADLRIRQLNSTKMPIKVELSGAWTFADATITAENAEKAAHYLLSPYKVNGEWFEDPDEDVVDRVGMFAERLGGKKVAGNSSAIKKLNSEHAKALEQMRSVFEPLRAELEKRKINWQYMKLKVGVDAPHGRLNISVRASGKMYIKLRSSVYDAHTLSEETGFEWKDGEYEGIRLAKGVSSKQLLNYLTGE